MLYDTGPWTKGAASGPCTVTRARWAYGGGPVAGPSSQRLLRESDSQSQSSGLPEARPLLRRLWRQRQGARKVNRVTTSFKLASCVWPARYTYVAPLGPSSKPKTHGCFRQTSFGFGRAIGRAAGSISLASATPLTRATGRGVEVPMPSLHPSRASGFCRGAAAD